ncbi:hypothetical protein [Nonomuraea mesophila]|uniref:hypothetical protein n=1 Tax=Nonomuraea mesophila TaxID=2530382 RepID=UPI00319DA02A
MTRWKSRASDPATREKSANELGQPCVSSSGSASRRSERTCAKCTRCPSISVVYCGSALSRASCARQS